MTETHDQPDQEQEETPVADAIEDAQRRLEEAEKTNGRIEALTKRLGF